MAWRRSGVAGRHESWSCTSDVRILKFLVRVYPRTSTKDPHPRLCPQADAVSDPLSVRESAARLLTHQQLCAVYGNVGLVCCVPVKYKVQN